MSFEPSSQSFKPPGYDDGFTDAIKAISEYIFHKAQTARTNTSIHQLLPGYADVMRELKDILNNS